MEEIFTKRRVSPSMAVAIFAPVLALELGRGKRHVMYAGARQ
jgi:hypothetical protein